jgi:hypothetical protein
VTCVSDVEGTNSFSQTALGGTVSLRGGRLTVGQFYSVVFASEDALSRCEEISPHVLTPSGVAYTLPPISRPKPWTLYFFSVPQNRFITLAELSQQRVDSLPTSQPEAATRDVILTATEQVGNLFPQFTSELRGVNEVRISNPNGFAVTAGVRSGKGGKNLQVLAGSTASVWVPDDRYDIYFVYSDKPDALFQGDSFTLNGNGVEIQIVKVVNGNYGIRQVK